MNDPCKPPSFEEDRLNLRVLEQPEKEGIPEKDLFPVHESEQRDHEITYEDSSLRFSPRIPEMRYQGDPPYP